MPDAHWVHNLDPFALRFTGEIGIRWYGLAYLVGIALGWWLMRRWSQRGLLDLDRRGVDDVVLYLGLGIILGGRLGYCLLYDPSLFGFSGAFPYWGVLALHRGGMASHGGIVGMLIGGLLLVRKHRSHLPLLADAVATAAPVGVICGRIANFINGELYGRTTDAAIGVHFPSSVAELTKAGSDPEILMERWTTVLGNHADLFQAAMLKAGNPISPALQRLLEQGDGFANLPADVQRSLAGLTWPSGSALLTPDSPWYAAAWQILVEPRHPSQLYAALSEGLIPFVVALFLLGRHRRPGLNCAVVLVLYAIGRMANESFRQWDIGHEPLFGLITKGQLYSLPVLIIGLIIGIRAWRKGSRPELYPPVPPPPTGQAGT